MSNNTEINEKKKENTKWMKRMAWVILITFLIICVMSVIGVVLIGIFQKTVTNIEKGVESTLLSTGLSIIGIAIAVWAGLNIINAVTKEDLYETKQKLEKMNDKYKSIYDETQKTTISHYKELFLQELFKTEKDIFSRYFYYKFSPDNDERDVAEDLEFWSSLYQIEQKFVEVYNLHQSVYAENSVLVNKANTGIFLIEELKREKSIDTDELFTESITEFKSDNLNFIIMQFLHFRKAEFNFYKSYVKTNNIEVAENFLSSAKAYYSFAKVFGCFKNQNDIDDIRADIPDYKGKHPEIAAYLANSIGESYSKIVHQLPKSFDTFKTSHGNIEQNFLEGYAKKAIFYCECAVKWAPKARETYNRNLGCAYERAERLKNEVGSKKKEVLRNYKTSLSLMIEEKTSSIITQNNVYHVILSYYERIVRQRFTGYEQNIFNLKCENIETESQREVVRFEKIKSAVEIAKKPTYDKSELVKDLIDYIAIAEMGVLQNCHHTLRTALLGMAYTYVVILLKADISLAKSSFKDVGYYMKRIYEIISILNLEFDIKEEDDDKTKSKKFDDYSYEVLLRYNGLESI